MNDRSEKITVSELEIMESLWRANRELTLAEIVADLQSRREWKYSTIKTLLYRLCDKGAVEVEKMHPCAFRTLITRQEYNRFSTQTLINRLYAGSAKNLIASLVHSHQLSERDLEDLRRLFEQSEYHD